MSRKRKQPGVSRTVLRRRLVVLGGLMGLCAFALLARAVELQILRKDFLQDQGDSRYLRKVEIPAYRGAILDRNGEPLGVSTPVESVWANPGEVLQVPERLPKLAKTLGLEADELSRYLAQRDQREFVYLRRHVNPSLAEKVMDLKFPGVALQREYRRYYPAGEVAAHAVGFTNIDDEGQEGLELAFDEWLSGEPGAKMVIKDRLGRYVENVKRVADARPGHDLTLSIDRRLQYIAYRGLKATVLEHGAKSGSVVVLDIPTGEVLAMVNQPSYNPNRRQRAGGDRYRNIALTDFYEPGSVMKPFIVAAALESGEYGPHSPVDTAPGWFQVGGHTVEDIRNHGLLDVTGVITKSSNVGAAKIALSLEPDHLWGVLSRFGFGEVTGSGFPGESPGILSHWRHWGQIEQATIAYGYGVSVTPLQLASATSIIADRGRSRSPTFVKGARNPAQRVMDANVADQVLAMMETVVENEAGTGNRARVPHYRVAGKTGTSRKAMAGGYSSSQYVSVFTGVAPVSDPRICVVVLVDDPSGKQYYGGQVAAPLGGDVLKAALRLFDVPPDDAAGEVLTADAGGEESG
jgi:cell division protein FtsI (penicillin-binding protein 3)